MGEKKKKKQPYSCNYCFDTGCACGGIGLSCHGCCICPEGERARQSRKDALASVARMVGVKEIVDEPY